MIQIIAGKKGSGKTKRLIDMTNAAAKTAEGSIIFIDDDTSYMFDIDHQVRFINASEYNVKKPDTLLGFLSGILSSNYDVTTVFVDGFKRLYAEELQGSANFFRVLEQLSAKHKVNFIMSVSEEPDALPDCMKTFLL